MKAYSNAERLANLKKLADYLDDVELNGLKFHMANFTTRGWGVSEEEFTDCGTGGCAAGHGPYAGIPKELGETFHRYSYRSFIPMADDEDLDYERDDLWNWLFDGDWWCVDDTPEGAAARIRYFLHHGNIPEEYEEDIEGPMGTGCYDECESAFDTYIPIIAPFHVAGNAILQLSRKEYNEKFNPSWEDGAE